jgi:hypothetical protein
MILNCFATPGSLSRRVVVEGSLGIADIYMLLYVIIRYSLLMLQDASLRWVRLLPLYSGISAVWSKDIAPFL